MSDASAAPRTRGYGPRWDNLPLDEWLSVIESDSDQPVVDFAFPHERLLAEYLDSIPTRTDREVRDLLRHFLIPSGETGSDETRVEWLKRLFLEDSPAFGDAITNVEYYRRLFGLDGEPAWQGLSWVLDLLPRWPMRAIKVLEAYFLAHMHQLPDGRIWGIGDAQAVIRAMWIGNPTSGALKRQLLYELGPEPFEHVIEAMYYNMGYKTALTARTRDGGRDIEVTRDIPGGVERLLVECKLWRRPVGVEAVRSFRGVLARDLASLKGFFISASSFTQPAREFAAGDPQLQLLAWDALLPLLDEHLGGDWGRAVDTIISLSIGRTRPDVKA